MKALEVFSTVFLFCVPSLSWAQIPGKIDSVRVDQDWASVGDEISITVDGSGKVGLENDIAAMSTEVLLDGKTVIQLGKIPAPGLYAIRLFDSSQQPLVVSIAALVQPESRLDIQSRTDRIGESKTLDAEVLKKFWAGATSDRLWRATTAAFPKWAGKNVAALGTTTVTCTMCFAGGVAACPVCVETGAVSTVQLSLDIATELARIQEKDGVLTREEANQLVTVIQIGQSLGAIATGSGLLGKSLEVVNVVVDVTVDNYLIQASVANTAGQIDKVYLLVEVLNKL